jgi:hypothetical protein
MKKRNKSGRQPKPVKRDLSQIHFTGQHWWKQQPWRAQFANREQTPIDVQKAAMIYEGMRRRAEVQRAWSMGEAVPGHNENFTGIVIQHLLCSWVDLNEMVRRGIINSIQSPWFVPPAGYSTFPDKSSPEKCRQAAMQMLRLPAATANADEAQKFVEYVRKFEDAGFVIAAVDNKTSQSIRYAFNAIKRLGRSLRKADSGLKWIAHLPAQISNADRQVAEEKIREGTFTQSELEELHQKYSPPGTYSKRVREQAIEQATGRISAWRAMAEVRPRALHKRQRGEDVVEEKIVQFC